MIDTADGSFVLRRQGGNAFSDPQLDGLVGRRARLEGTAMATTFVIDRWHLPGRGMTPRAGAPPYASRSIMTAERVPS